MRCSDMCKTCLDGFSNGRCSSCDKPYFLRGSTCVETCYPDHTLEDLMGGETPSGNIRLVNGSNDREGFIQMRTKSQNNYKWGIICNTNQVITTLVCQELGFQSGSLVRYNRLYSFARVPIFQVSCNGYEKYLTDCNLHSAYYCARPFIACSNKPLDKRVCRKENTIPCASGVCFSYPSVSCANGDGKVVPKGRSYCKHCPPNYYGDGVNCQAISKVAPSVRQTYIEHQLRLRATYYFPCFGRSGTLYIYPNRKSWFKDEKNVDVSSGRFRLGPVQYEDAGIYKCLLGNSMGSVTITFNITIV
ncbi:deleted in malignant brain tumors 1 -like, partial [Paramuricea clavata]